MANEAEYNRSLDEIVFENRNKEYGAYDLRSSYRRILTKSFIVGTALFLLAAITPFVIMKIKQMDAKDKAESNHELVEILPEEEQILEQPEDTPPPPPPPPAEEPKVEIIQNIVPEPVKAPKIETPPPTIKEQLVTNTGAVNQDGDKVVQNYTPPVLPTGPSKSTNVEAKPQINPNEVYTSVDQQAEYPGGMNGLRKFLGDNFDVDVMEGGEGTLKAKIKFVVEKDGTVSQVQVAEKSGNRDFDNESIKVVKKMKKWSPAKKDGQNVRSWYTVPFVMNFE